MSQSYKYLEKEVKKDFYFFLGRGRRKKTELTCRETGAAGGPAGGGGGPVQGGDGPTAPGAEKHHRHAPAQRGVQVRTVPNILGVRVVQTILRVQVVPNILGVRTVPNIHNTDKRQLRVRSG